jgi:lysyl-tRNA synthetase class 2
LRAARVQNLKARSQILAEIRAFFAARGFVEIEAPILVPSPGLEVHLDAYRVDGGRYLITSPEYQMKRLLGDGMERIFSLGKVFRRGEVGAHHNPEFTMLEWYRANAAWEEIARDVEELVGSLLPALAPPWQRLSVRQAFAQFAGIALDGNETPAELRHKLSAHALPKEGDFGDLFFSVFLDRIEPELGKTGPLFLYDWPLPLGALARKKPSDPRVVERFEAFVRGPNGPLELCNGFGELIDPLEQRSRCIADLAERRRRGLPEYPLDEKFLEALGRMAPSAGVALGVDRLMMLRLGAREIREVLAFADDEL